MLATHNTLDPEDLFTITAGGFSATADAFARDPDSQGLWFLSMVGSQTALKAIWASLLKQPPDTAHIIKGADGMALSEGYQRCSIPYGTIGTWTTKIAKLPVSRRLARPGVYQDCGVRLRAGRLPAAGAERRRKRRRFTADSSTREARCPCTAPGPAGCGTGAFRPARSRRSSPPASSPTGATPRPRSSGRTSRKRWRREG